MEGCGPDKDTMLVREYARKSADLKALALDGANTLWASCNEPVNELMKEYGALPSRVEERKEQMVQADAYKRKARKAQKGGKLLLCRETSVYLSAPVRHQFCVSPRPPDPRFSPLRLPPISNSVSPVSFPPLVSAGAGPSGAPA